MRAGGPALPALLFLWAAVACGAAGTRVGDAGSGTTCYDANGTYVGPHRASDDVCLYKAPGGNWKADPQTGELLPVFDEDRLALVFADSGCSGKEMVRCFEAPCMQDTFVTWDDKVRVARASASMELRTLRSYHEPRDGSVIGQEPSPVCNDYRVSMAFLSVPLDDCPEVARPVAKFVGPLRRSP
ncbi:MAG TPA: hypothetical protein VGK67_01355 [Myxococcales bacterium]|jgi:hypothetical protein